MSLINEALRKARAEAAEREGRRYGVPRGLALPPRRSRYGPRAALLAILVLAAAAVGAAVAWWVFGHRPGATRAAAATATSANPAPGATAAGAPTPPRAPARAAAPAPTEAAKPPVTTTPPLAGAAGPLATPLPTSAGTPAEEPTKAPPTPAPGPPQHAVPPIRGVSAALAPSEPTAAAADERGPARPLPSPAELPDAGGQGERQTSRGSAGSERERSFVIDADLGRVKLHLDYVVYRPGSPFASINGGQVVVGSVIEGLTVEEIGSDFVRLSDRHGAVVLRVR